MMKIKKTNVFWLAVIQTLSRDFCTGGWGSPPLAKHLLIPLTGKLYPGRLAAK